jgi:hypothetical protein
MELCAWALAGALAANALFLPGTLVHAYYLMPVLVPLALCAAFALSLLSHQERRGVVVAVAVILAARGDLTLLRRQLAPWYPVALPAAMQFASVLARPGDACIAVVGRSIPNHQWYLSETQCRYYAPEEVPDAGVRASRLLASDSTSVFVYTVVDWRPPVLLAACENYDFKSYVVARCRSRVRSPSGATNVSLSLGPRVSVAPSSHGTAQPPQRPPGSGPKYPEEALPARPAEITALRMTSMTLSMCGERPSHMGSLMSRSATSCVTDRLPTARPNRLPAGEEWSGT